MITLKLIQKTWIDQFFVKPQSSHTDPPKKTSGSLLYSRGSQNSVAKRICVLAGMGVSPMAGRIFSGGD